MRLLILAASLSASLWALGGCEPESGREGVPLVGPDGEALAGDGGPLNRADLGPQSPDGGPAIDDVAGQARLFSARVLTKVEIELEPLVFQQLEAEPRRDYVPARITIDGRRLGLVGLKLKGGRGSFRKITQKAAFKIALDRFDARQNLFGLRKLTFNNMIQDVTKMRERLASLMFQRFGLPAARVGYAEITVNGRPYGLYAHVETLDAGFFGRAFPGESLGLLYEGSNDADLRLRQVDWFDRDVGKDPDERALRGLIGALDSATPNSFEAVLGEVFDWEMVRRFFAAEMLTGHWDGYAQLQNNYFVYRHEDAGRWIFLPWGTDQAFQRTRDAFKGPGRVFRMCADWTACRVPYAQTVEQLAELMRSEDWGAEMDALDALTAEPFSRDRKTPTRPAQRLEGIEALRLFIESQPDRIVASLRCLDGPDTDADGVFACAGDCDDTDPSIHPGAVDTCRDEIDQDCSGFTDDGQFCAPCREAIAPNGARFLLCHRSERFGLARDTCAEHGGSVASIRNQLEQDFITQAAFERKIGRWWIGLYDYYEEGRYEWHDGSEVNFTAWSEGEPNNHGGYEDCVCFGSANRPSWNDLYCGTYMPVVCRVE